MGSPHLTVDSFFPFWDQLSADHKEDLIAHSQPRHFSKGEVILPYKGECLGLVLVQSGQLRAFVLSDQGKEITLYRLFEHDICLFSAACVMHNIQFDIHIQAERETETLLVPTSLYSRLSQQSIAMSQYANELMSSRFSDVMWTLEQVLFQSMDSRIAQFLLDQTAIQGGEDLILTHDTIARDLGTAREVVTRMLKRFVSDGVIAVGRGRVQIRDRKALYALAE